jgi:hypothetical protein
MAGYGRTFDKITEGIVDGFTVYVGLPGHDDEFYAMPYDAGKGTAKNLDGWESGIDQDFDGDWVSAVKHGYWKNGHFVFGPFQPRYSAGGGLEVFMGHGFDKTRDLTAQEQQEFERGLLDYLA